MNSNNKSKNFLIVIIFHMSSTNTISEIQTFIKQELNVKVSELPFFFI